MRTAPLYAVCIALALPLAAAASPRARAVVKKPQTARENALRPRTRQRANVRAQTVRLPRQRTNTIVRQWRTGSGEDHNVIFLHGLGGLPEGPMSNGIMRRLDERGVNATISAPILREVELRDGQVVRENTQTMTEQLKHAREVIENTPGKVVLFGHSFGAKAALVLAREYPEKVTGVIAIAPSVKMLYSYWKRLSGQRGLADKVHMEEVFTSYENRLKEQLRSAETPALRLQLSEALTYHEVMQDLLHHNEVAMEGPMPVPTLVMHGTADQAVSQHYVKRFAENSRNVKLVMFEGHDHHLMGPATNQTLDQVAGRVAAFLRDH